MTMSVLYESFQKYFEIVIADTPELLENVYRIRYQVLCVEQRIPGFEPSHYPDQLEKDDNDSHSVHSLLRLRSSGDFIGTVRLILFNPLQPEKLFPVELNTQFDPELCNMKSLSRQQTAEVSRFVVVDRFNRRKENRRKRDSTVSENSPVSSERRSSDRRSGLSIALMLMAGVMRMSVQHNIKNWLSMMDSPLNRLLSFDGLDFIQIGPPVDYHGIRRPYFVRVEDVLNRMYREHYDAWEVVTDCGKYNPSSSAHGNVLNQEHIF
ncbi:PEP-CTERM/exosortase system-associated acyltransferase [Nitrosomonas sp. Nm166]|uniref:PEP-CTERM/exosortase system-associated acyltransferase n=1 Tax=Nitrosomonas sp. Nm166 TaxID=1881054 RepID=UPI0008E0365B|nr:PEP-CTERM/exosortase system-associated acyltransferase [Nitrosomonas sp. Nm166]SFE61011.1 N-acyl amino acid synthase, PEP-CTERM/exosortase system-associated [Nitrosomonas sp. Nm166]